MLDKIDYIEVDGHQYPMMFTFNTMETLQEEYGTIKKWEEALNYDDDDFPINVKEFKHIITLMINEGIEYLNEIKGLNEPLITEKKAGIIITSVGIADLFQKYNDVVHNSNVVEEKNVTAPKNQK